MESYNQVERALGLLLLHGHITVEKAINILDDHGHMFLQEARANFLKTWGDTEEKKRYSHNKMEDLDTFTPTDWSSVMKINY